MRSELGDEYTTTLRKTYEGRVPGGADLVCYWFEKARTAIESGGLTAAGLVSTNSIRGGKNRKVLEAICQATRIYEAWSDEGWVNEGAAVRVSLVAFGESGQSAQLDGSAVPKISEDLTSAEADLDGKKSSNLTSAMPLPSNCKAAYVGIQKTGPFEISGDIARNWLRLPNPHGLPNSVVVRPWFNGLDVTRRNRDMWIVDFGVDIQALEAALFEKPFEYLTQHVKPMRIGKREARTNECYWLFQWSRPVMRAAIHGLSRFIVTPEVAKHRNFAWLTATTVADKNLTVIARADDTTFGILHSRFHELWSLRMCTWLGVGNDPRYTPTTCFETFPFAAGLTPADTAHQRTETLASGALIPADIHKENQPLAVIDKGQAATKLISTSANETVQPTAAEVGVVRMSGAILKSNAYEPPACEPAAPGESPQTVAHHNASPSTSKSSTQATAPAPRGLREHAIAIAQAAKKLNDLREAWLTPPEWTHRVPEVIPLGLDHSPYPDRIEPRPGISEADLKALQKRTLTNLYNAKPAWLTLAHQHLDAAVAAAYGWADYSPALPDDKILKRLLALNLARSI